jgi:hypothetical protein
MKKKQAKMNKNIMEDLTIIIPVHTTEFEDFDSYFDAALKSIANNCVRPEGDESDYLHPHEIIIPIPSEKFNEISSYLKTFDFAGLNVRCVQNDQSSTFAGQINFASNEVETKYMTFLEFDDEVGDVFMQNAKQYTDYYGEAVYLPMITDVDKDGNMIGFTNEAAWASNFTETPGKLDIDTVLQYPNFSFNGMIIPTKTFQEIGKIKENIELTFGYEFLLRTLNMGNDIFVIPKFVYKHMSMRPNSLFYLYKNDNDMYISSKDAELWIQIAKEEYLFRSDREINKENYSLNEQEK